MLNSFDFEPVKNLKWAILKRRISSLRVKDFMLILAY